MFSKRNLRKARSRGLLLIIPMTMIVNMVYAASTDTKESGSTADHTRFEALQQNFETGPDVTKAYQLCRLKASKQIHKITHPATGQVLGKKEWVNGFYGCITTNGTPCNESHIGYGWKGHSFDSTAKMSVDCLAYQDTTDSYKKHPVNADNPFYGDKVFPPMKDTQLFKAANLSYVAQIIFRKRRND